MTKIHLRGKVRTVGTTQRGNTNWEFFTGERTYFNWRYLEEREHTNWSSLNGLEYKPTGLR